MDMESQKILFALSTPMEIRNECCLPSHSSPKMYLGTCFFDLSSSWGIDDRDDLLRTIHRMIDNGHAARLAGFYHRWFRYSPCEWRDYLAELNEQGQAYAQFVASTAECCGEGGIKAWDYVRMGFLSRMGVLNNWLSEEGECLPMLSGEAAQSVFDGDYDEIEIRQEWQEENTLHEWDEGEFQLEPPLDTEEGRAAADEWDER
jgi:hypothetical protein